MILITGGSGFVGGAIAESLGDRAVTVSRSSGPGKIKHIRFDLTATDQTDELIKQLQQHNVTHIIHAAATTPWSKDPDYSADIKMAATISEISTKLDSIKQVFFLSGWNVYQMKGNKSPYDEDTPVGAPDEYGKSKLKTEQYLKKHIKGAKLANLRLASIYGPGQKSAGLIPNLVRSALTTKKIRINAVKTSRDYLYIDDLKSVIDKMVEEQLDDYLELNIGSGASVSVETVANTVKHVCKSEYGLSVSIEQAEDLHEADIIDNRLSIKKAQDEYNLLKKVTPFEEGLRNYIAWVKQ